MLDHLPKELLFEIFDLLPVADLLSLATVCQTFNIFINNTKLVEKFTLSFDRDFTNRDWIGSRRYTKLSIETDTGAFAILKAIGDDIRHISFSAKSIDLKTIARLLSLCPNAASLKFVDVKTHSCLDLTNHRDMPRHRDLELWIENTTPNILEVFRFVEVRKLTLLAPTSMSDFGVCWNVDDCRITFNNFMRVQRKLSHLDMRNFKANASIFSDKGLHEVPFRLTDLKLHNFAVTNGNFQQFLANHVDSLEMVSLDSPSMTDDLMAFLTQCTALTDLEFHGHLKNHKRQLKTVRKFHADLTNAPANWTDMLPNLCDLKLSWNCKQMMTGLDKLQRLERLEIHGSHFCGERFLNIPSVRWLKMREVTFDRAVIFEKCPVKLQELHVESMSVECLRQLMSFSDLRLQRIVIRNPIMLNFYRRFLNFEKQQVGCVKVFEYGPAMECDGDDDDDY
jgi:hypothetical protein